MGRSGAHTVRVALAAAVGFPALLAGCKGGFGCGDTGLGPCGTPGPLPAATLTVAAADFNGDGRPDVAAGVSANAYNQPGEIDVYAHAPATGAGYGAPLVLPDGVSFSVLTAVDVDGDGRPDLIAANLEDGAVRVFLNEASAPGTFAAPVRLAAAGVTNVAVGDLNGDGAPDLVASADQLLLFAQDPQHRGSFAAPLVLDAAGAGWVAVGDLNGDGVPDIAYASAAGVNVLFRTGAPGATTFSAAVTVYRRAANANFGGADNTVGIADLDGDGLADLVITDPGPGGGAPATVTVLLQNPGAPGTFLAPAVYPLPGDAGGPLDSIVIADLDGDGRPDLVIGGTSSVNVLLQAPTGHGSFRAATAYPAPLTAFSVAVADVDGDGRPDLIVNGSAVTNVDSPLTLPPGVLLQDPAHPGTFLPVRNLR